MKKILSSVILAASLCFASVANAGLIQGSNWDDINDITTGTFNVSNGLNKWNVGDTFITQHIPGTVSAQTGDFTDLFSSLFHVFYGLSDLSTSGSGTLAFNNHYAIGSQTFNSPISFVGLYDVITFTATSFQTVGQGTLTFGANSVLLDFTSNASYANNSASISSRFNIADVNNSGSTTSVPEPSSLALLAFGGIGLMLRRKTKQNNNQQLLAA